MSKVQNITAIIYDKRGRILSIGKNSYIKTHPMQARLAKKCGEVHKIYQHAEIAAIVKCKDLTKAHTIEIIRLDASGKELDSKPCKICQMAIRESGIQNVRYTIEER